MREIKDVLAKYQIYSLPAKDVENSRQQQEDRLEPVNCPYCDDRGLILDGDVARPCQCMQQKDLINKFKYARMSREMMLQTFIKFRLDYYSRCLVDEKDRSYFETAQKGLQGAKDFVNAYLTDQNTPGILFTGQVGSGKTFLACAIANELMEHDKEVLFLIVPDMLDELRASFNRRDAKEYSELDLLDTARTVPVLIMDDLGAHNYTEWSTNRIYSIINYRMNHQLPTVITTNLNISELGEYLGERTKSRILQMCRLFRLQVERDIRMLKYQERENKRN